MSDKREILELIERAAKERWTTLSLVGYQMTSLPTEIAKLPNLNFLDLSLNQLKSLPPEIAQLTKLNSLLLGGNQIKSLPVAITNLANLTSLDLSNNRLTYFPAEITSLTSLTSLDLFHNELKRVPPEIGNLINLTRLHLSGNQLTSLPPIITKLTKLTSLFLAYNQLTSLPHEITKLTNLTSLFLEGNPLPIPPETLADPEDVEAIFAALAKLNDGQPRSIKQQLSETVQPTSHSRIFRIVVASPGDVQSEREVLPTIIEEVNRHVAADRGLHLVLTRWETDTHPGFHSEGPQGLIDPILKITDCDLLIGIFWKRFGTPTTDGKTGTEHEFSLAYEAWKEKRSPQIFVYFNQKPYAPNSKAEVEQWGQVLEFRDKFPKEGLWWLYEGEAQFERLVRNHLMNHIRSITSTTKAEG